MLQLARTNLHPTEGGSRICPRAAYADGLQGLVMMPKTTGNETCATAVTVSLLRTWA